MTTLVVGAGASHEYRLPLGLGLHEDVMRALHSLTTYNEYDAASRANISDKQLLQSLQREGFSNAQALLDAAGEFSRLAFAYRSVDEALHAFSHDPQIVEIGKLAIASRILTGERESELADKMNAGEARIRNIGGWLSRLFTLAVSGHKRNEIPEVAFQNLQIINFNYDRCIEYYLRDALLAVGLPADAAEETVNDLSLTRMIRPYGSLGPLPWQGKGGTGFGVYQKNLQVLAGNLRTFTETLDENVSASIARVLEKSDVVIFLGFGYAPQNMNIMELRSDFNGDQRVFATAYKIDDRNHPTIREQLTQHLRITGRGDIALVNAACTEMLDNLAHAIAFAVG